MNTTAKAHAGYYDASKQARVTEANAHELISILFDELANLLDEIAFLVKRDKGNAIRDQEALALSIIDSLIISLDMQRGGPLASNLKANYTRMRWLLTSSDATNRLTNILAASQIVFEIRDAWKKIG